MMVVFETDVPTARAAHWGAWQAYYKAMVNAGVHVSGNALQPASTARTVHVENGGRTVQDGPFADTREELGGYVIIDVPTLHDALEWAARCPAASYGTLEIRPLLQKR